MCEAGQVFWRMCEPIALATGSEDPERDGRGLAAMVDGLLLDRLAHPPQTARAARGGDPPGALAAAACSLSRASEPMP